MKNLIINKDHLVDVLDHLWEACEANRAEMEILPSQNAIIVKRSGAIVAHIKVATLVEPYDIKEEIFNTNER